MLFNSDRFILSLSSFYLYILKLTISFGSKLIENLPCSVSISSILVSSRLRYKEIKDNMLGWDITDFGHGDYEKIGLLMFTIRNGSLESDEYSKPYAEKLLISQEFESGLVQKSLVTG